MKKQFFLLACAAMVASMGWANDSEYFAIGNQLVPLKQTTIRVSKEVLSIDLRDDGSAYVDVQYEFTNPESEPKTILMGFEADPPYQCYEENRNTRNEHPYIKRFTVEINGQKVACKNAISKIGQFRPINKPMQLCGFNEYDDSSLEDMAYVYYFNATFKPGVNKVHHTYHYKLGASTEYYYFLEYKLSPAARWANKQIDDFTLIVSAKNTAKHFFIGTWCLPGMKPVVASGKGKFRKMKHPYDDSLYEWEMTVRNGAFRFHTTNFRPKEELFIHSGLLCDGLNVTYDRGIFIADCVHGNGYSDDFRTRVIHNLPYASRGRVFKNPELKKFFESCFWYMPNPKYKDDTSDFTQTDWECVNY